MATVASSLPPTTTLSPTQFKKQWTLLLGAALESWAHQLLYVRHVYPRETFAGSSYLGVRCFVSRHPGVVAYVTNTLNVAVPSLVAGVADELALTICDHDPARGHDTAITASPTCTTTCSRELERYMLRFSSAIHLDEHHQESSSRIDTEVIQQLERRLRDLVLSVHSLESGYATTSDSVSFKLSLRVPEKDSSCPVLNDAFAVGSWYAPAAAAGGSSDAAGVNNGGPSSAQKGRSLKPVKHLSLPSICSLQFLLEKPKNKRKKPPSSS